MIPNILTLLRIALTLVFSRFYLKGYTQIAFVIFLIACITDVLDGYIARRFDMITDFGKLVDPFADKFMVLTSLFCFIVKGEISIWYFYILLVKEILLIVFALLILKDHTVVFSKNFGKLSSLLINLGIFSVLLSNEVFGNVFIITGIVCAVIGVLQYALNFVDIKLFWRK